MTVPSPGPAGRLPRYVWVLLALIVVVLGFAVGGSLRAAFAATSSGPKAVAPAAKPLAHVRAPAATPAAAPTVVPAVVPGVTKPAVTRAAPAVATASRRGKAVPAGSGTGRRIVYQESTMHLWVVDATGAVVRDYPVTGRPGWPKPGTYHVFSKSRATVSPKYGVTFDWMVRFAHGHQLNIGFHDIPRVIGTGVPIQAEAELGAPVGHGGCVRQRTVDAKWLYGWATVGTTVVVLK